jgi:periplasmic protein TonB
MITEIEISGFDLVLVILGLILLTIGLIYFFRWRYNSYNIQDLKSSNCLKSYSLPSQRTKYPELDVYKNSASFFNYGMIAALILSLAAISWTTYEEKIKMNIIEFVPEDLIEMDVPRIPEPPSPPPPPQPIVVEVPDAEVLEDTYTFLNDDITAETMVESPIAVEKKLIPPPPPPPLEEGGENIFKVVEQMPRFPGCEGKITNKEKDDCAKTKMLEYIYKYLKYPALAREVGVEGQVVLQFVVDKDGTITETKVVRDIGAGCGAEAEKVVNAMNNMGQKWIPGKQGGRPVRVLYTLPVKFKLEK